MDSNWGPRGPPKFNQIVTFSQLVAPALHTKVSPKTKQQSDEVANVQHRFSQWNLQLSSQQYLPRTQAASAGVRGRRDAVPPLSAVGALKPSISIGPHWCCILTFYTTNGVSASSLTKTARSNNSTSVLQSFCRCNAAEHKQAEVLGRQGRS